MTTIFVTIKDEDLHSPEQFLDYITEALDYMQQKMPRTFVNFVNMLNSSEAQSLNIHTVCNLLHKSECPCAAFPESKRRVSYLFTRYSKLTENLIKSGRYDTKEDFTVVYQPFFRDFKLFLF